MKGHALFFHACDSSCTCSEVNRQPERVVGRIVGRETHADGTEYVSFRVVEGSMPAGPWNGRCWALVETDLVVDP